LIGASYCPNEGMANALAAVVALADAARTTGSRFMLNARAKTMSPCGDGWRIDTERGNVRCNRIVIAAGTWSNEVATMAGAELPLTRRLIQMIVTEPCQRFLDHLVYHGEHRLTLKQVNNGNVLIGGGWTATSDSVYGRPAVLRDSVLGSLELAVRIVPKLRSAAVVRAWAGPNAYTPDGRPILGGIPGRDGLYAAVCNTYGFTLGPLCGLLVAQMLAGRDTTVSMREFQPARFDSADMAR
jgi:glycine/D-amino acid oxidase-like deaminating enzyme